LTRSLLGRSMFCNPRRRESLLLFVLRELLGARF
jgi:hypothetical protein